MRILVRIALVFPVLLSLGSAAAQSIDFSSQWVYNHSDPVNNTTVKFTFTAPTLNGQKVTFTATGGTLPQTTVNPFTSPYSGIINVNVTSSGATFSVTASGTVGITTTTTTSNDTISPNATNRDHGRAQERRPGLHRHG